jgi:hypothetical protein
MSAPTKTVFEVRYASTLEDSKALSLHSTHETYLDAKNALNDAKETFRANGENRVAKSLTITDRKVRIK